MTLDLGFAWTRLPVGEVAFVDVPGHERFVPTMLAGVGPVPAALFVVAADGGWMPQSTEHLDALDALGVRHGVLAVTRSDLADPGPALAAARERLARTSLGGSVPAVAVSAATGAGFDELRAALGGMLAALPVPGADEPVRLWVDRAFTIRGSGTVVTGTLGAGTLAGRRRVVAGRDAGHGARPAVAGTAGHLDRRHRPGGREPARGAGLRGSPRRGAGHAGGVDVLVRAGRGRHHRGPGGRADAARRVGGGPGPGPAARRHGGEAEPGPAAAAARGRPDAAA